MFSLDKISFQQIYELKKRHWKNKWLQPDFRGEPCDVTWTWLIYPAKKLEKDFIYFKNVVSIYLTKKALHKHFKVIQPRAKISREEPSITV